MRAEVRSDREHSSDAFVHTVWPIIQKQCPELCGGVLRLVEGHDSDPVASELDVWAGIDAYQRTAYGLRGMGVRVQWRTNYHTFTVRLARPTGTLTEYQKRLRTLKRRDEGFFYPHWTIQAYVSKPGADGALLAVAVAKTVELYHYIEQRAQCRQPCPEYRAGTSGERFLAVDWCAYQQSGNYLFIYTAPHPGTEDV